METGYQIRKQMDYNGLCRGCGGHPGGCVCGREPQPSGRLEDISAMAAVSAAAGVECVAAATLLATDESLEVVIARLDDASLAVLNLASRRYSRIDHDELLWRDGDMSDDETIGQHYSLELSPEDARRLGARLEADGWRVGTSRLRRRNDILDRLGMIDVASAATGIPCIATVDVVDESGEPFGTAIVAQPPGGGLRLLDEMDHSEMPCGLTISFLPDDEPLADGIRDAGYVVYGTPPPPPSSTRRSPSQTAYSIVDSPGGGVLIKRMSHTDTCKSSNQAGPYIPKRFARNLGMLELGATEAKSRTMDMRIMIGNRCLGEQEVHYRWEHSKGEYRLTCLGNILREHAEEGDIFTIDLDNRMFRLVRRRQDGDWRDLMDAIAGG